MCSIRTLRELNFSSAPKEILYRRKRLGILQIVPLKVAMHTSLPCQVIERSMKKCLRHYTGLLIVIISLFAAPLMKDVIAASPELEKPGKQIVRFSAITLYHPIVMYQKYQPLMAFLSENTSYQFELKLSQNYNDIIQFLKEDQVQIALLGGVTYLAAKEQFNVVPVLKPLGEDGTPYYRSVFITRAGNDRINGITDLAGKSVAFASRMSTSGYIAPLYELYTKGGMTLDDLSKHVNLKYHDAVAREVLRGNFEAGVVINSVASRFSNKGLKVIHISDPIPGLPIVARADAPLEMIQEIKKALLGLDYQNPSHRKILDQWDEEFKYGFAEASVSDYEIIGTMIRYLAQQGVKTP